MAVYREGYHAVETLAKASKQIYPDAADYGVLVNKGDKNWNLAKQLVEWYRKEGTTTVKEEYETGFTLTAYAQLMDEWAVSDERKTVKEATENYRVQFVTIWKPDSNPATKGYIGYITVDKVK